jgi:hypothetical protein
LLARNAGTANALHSALLCAIFEITVMSKTLIIAEKPSVANDIAKALGGFTKHDEYFESDEYVLSSAVGHLVEIGVPEEYDVKRATIVGCTVMNSQKTTGYMLGAVRG